MLAMGGIMHVNYWVLHENGIPNVFKKNINYTVNLNIKYSIKASGNLPSSRFWAAHLPILRSNAKSSIISGHATW